MQLGGVNPINTPSGANAPSGNLQISAADFNSLEQRVKKIEDMHKYAKIVLIALVVLYLLNQSKK